MAGVISDGWDQFGAAAFYRTAEHFYGERFPGAIAAEYRQLREILAGAWADEAAADDGR